ncbi:MAG: Bax inhibitor-1/YccA family protein [Desulfovibrionaceae bacterium]|nr:Bax inhibitor-1/YccA family protein [Desulfovibrionaceae bacterium]
MYSSDKSISNITTLSTYLSSVFRYMAGGLCITAFISYFTIQSPTFMASLINNPFLYIALLVIEVVVAMYLSLRISTFSAQKATTIFILYSALNGITLAPLLFFYTGASVVKTFFICAGMFGAMSIYGHSTKRDLTSWGSFLFMGLIGIIIASLANFFFKSSAVNAAITYIGVFIFLGLTAYDVQKLKEFGQNMPTDNPTVAHRGIILGALTLYLDFINLFIYLLRIFGNLRDE